MPDFNIRVIVDPQDSTRGTRAVRGELRDLERTGVNVGRRIAAALAAAFTAVASGGALRAFSQLEQGLIGVAKTTDLTAAELAGLREEIVQVSRRLPFARTELLAIAQAAGQLGVRGVENLTLFSETIAKLGVASDLSGDQAAVALTRILTVTREGPEVVDRFASAIVALGNQFAATESEIADTATSVAAAGAVFGVSAAEAAALGASFRSVGVEAQVSGTTVGKSLQVVEAALRQGGDEMRILQDLTGQTRAALREAFQEDATGVFQQFLEGLGRVQEAGGSVNAVLEDLGLADQRILRSLGALAQNADLVGRAFNVANAEMENATALNEEVARNADSVATQYQLTANAVGEVVQSLGEALAPAFIEAAEAAREFIIAAQEGETLPAIYEAITAATLGVNDAFGFLAENSEIVAAAIGLIVARQIGLAAQSAAVVGAMASIRREIVNTQIAYELLGARTTAAIVAQRGFSRVAATSRAAVAGLSAAFGGPVGLAVAVGIAGAALGSYVSRTTGLEGATRAMRAELDQLTQSFDEQETSVDALVDKYAELGRAQLATAIIEAQLEVDRLRQKQERLRAEVDENIVSQILYLESLGRTPAEAGAASREAVDAFRDMRDSGEDVTTVVNDLAERLRQMGQVDVASALVERFNLVGQAADAVAERIERINRLQAAQQQFASLDPFGGPGRTIDTDREQDGAGTTTTTTTTPTTTGGGGGGGISFAEIRQALEQENELLRLNVREREVRAEVLRAEDALGRTLTATQRDNIEALVEERQALEDLEAIRDVVRDYEREAELLQLTERERDVRIEQLQLEERLARSLTAQEAALVEGYARENQVLRDVSRVRDEFVGGFEDLAARRGALATLFQEGTISADQFRDALADVNVQAMEMRIQLGEGSFADGFISDLFRATEAAQNFTAEAGGIFAQFTTQLSQGFGDAIGGMIFGTQKLSESLKEVARNAITQLISSLVQLGIQWVIQQALALALGSSATAATSALAGAAAAAWAPAAALASLATLGANAGPAQAAVATTLGLTAALAQSAGAFGGGGVPGLREGGQVEGPGTSTSDSILARLSDGEFVVNADATRKFLPLLERINRGEPISGIEAPGLARGGLIAAGPGDDELERILRRSDERTSRIIGSPAFTAPSPATLRLPEQRGGDTFNVQFAPRFESREAVDAFRETEAQHLASFGRTVDEIAARRRTRRARR